MLVWIIILNYCSIFNVEKWIKNCIRSLTVQNYRNFQCIFLDDASTDNTVAIIKKEIDSDIRFTILENTMNVGTMENIYKAVALSDPTDEDIIITLDGDDWLANTRVLSLLGWYYSAYDCWLTYGSHVLYPSEQRGTFCRGQVP